MRASFLVVDDTEVIRLSLARFLSRAYPGAETRSAADNGEALAALREFSPSLVLTDIRRPHDSGLDLLEALRANPLHWHIPVIVLSTTGGENELLYYRAGFNAVLEKPTELRDLVNTINRVLKLNVDADRALVYAGAESPTLDYKEGLDLATKDGRASLAKDVIAMANYGGGTIVVGVREPSPGHFEPVGVAPSQLATLEVTRLNQSLADYVDPPVHVSARRVRDGTREFVVLMIPPSKGSLVLAAKQNDAARLYPGRIYTRTAACGSAEVRTSAELRALLERLRI